MALRGGPVLESRWFTVGGRRLHARVGDGPRTGGADRTPVVLVHGVIVSSRYLLPTAVELAVDFPVLVPDLPGYGLSESNRRHESLETLADALIACALAAGHDRVALVGNSFGAQVAVEAALRHPDRVRSIALLGPTVDPAARSVVRQYARWQRNAPDEHLSCVPVMARDLADIGLRRAGRLLRVMVDDRIEDKLAEVTCPALVVRGGRDRVVPTAWAVEAARRLPTGKLVVVPGYAHMGHYSGALEFAPVLRRFLLAGDDDAQPFRGTDTDSTCEATADGGDTMGDEGHDRTSGASAPQVAAGMLEEAAGVAGDEPGEEDPATDSGTAEGLEPGTVADTGQPAGTVDARAAGVMDTGEESSADGDRGT